MGGTVEQFLRTTGGSTPPKDTSLVGRFIDNDDERRRLAAQQLDPSSGDSAARVLKLEARTGLPSDLIERNLETLEAQTSRPDFNPEKFRRESPIMASWLAEHPKHLALAGEDLTKLGYLERQFRNIKQQFSGGVGTVRLSVLGTKAMMGTITPAERKEQAALEDQLALASVSADQYDLNGMNQMPGVIANQLPIQLPTFFAGAIAGTVVGGVSKSEKAGQAAWRIGAGVEAGRMEASLAYLDFEKIRDDRGQPLDRSTALGASIVVGIVNGSLEMLGAEEIVKTIPGARMLTKRGLKQALTKTTTSKALKQYLHNIGEAAVTEGFTEFMQELVTSTAGEVAKLSQDATVKGKDGKPTPVTTRNLFDLIFSPEHLAAAFEAGKLGAMGGGGMTTITGAGSFASDVARARQSKAATQVMADLATTVQASKMMERLPDKMQEAVERLAADGPVENLYAPIKQFNEYFQGKDIDPERAAIEILGPEGAQLYAEADRTGSDLPIPTGRYATTIAQTEHNDFFINELRSDPSALSARETQERIKQMDEESIAQSKDEGDQATVERKESVTRVIDRVRGQLEQAGQDPKTAEQNASLHGDFFTRMSEKTGLTPESLFDLLGTVNISRVEDPTVDPVTMNQDLDPSELGRINIQDIEDEDADTMITWHAGVRRHNTPGDMAMWEGGVRMKLNPETMVAQITGSELPKNLRGKGWGTALYRALIDKAHGEGFRVYSDAAVSPDADRIYDKLKQLGYDVNFRKTDTKELMAKYEVGPKSPETEYRQDEVARQIHQLLEGFHSKAERVITDKMGNRASVKEVKSLLKEVKEEEREWTGIDDFLNNMPEDAKITKQDVLSILEGGRVQLVELVDDADTASQARMERVEAMQRELMITDINTFIRSFVNVERVKTTEGYMWHAGLSDGWDKSLSDFRIKDYYNIIGGKVLTDKLHDLFSNESDIMLVGDNNTRVEAPMGIIFSSGSRANDREGIGAARRELSKMVFENLQIDDAIDDYYGEMANEEVDEDDGAAYQGYTLGSGVDIEDYRVYKLTIPDIVPGFQSNHFKDTNVVVHFRTSTRVDADGKNMFFVEEIQSDWHQHGRERGYVLTKSIDRLNSTIEQLRAERATLVKEFDAVDRTLESNEVGHADNLNLIQHRMDLRDAIQGIDGAIIQSREDLVRMQTSSVSDAPFKSTWHELALKRILRLAAEQGYESIGWTTGNQQADRYTLDKIVDELQLKEYAHGRVRLQGFQGVALIFDKEMDPKELSSYIGKAAAENLLNQPSEERRDHHTEDTYFAKSLSGEALRAGEGGGMRGFYDGIVPQFLKKFTKKYGGEVGQTTVEISSANGAELKSGTIRPGREKFFHDNDEITAEQYDGLIESEKHDDRALETGEFMNLRSMRSFETDVHQLKLTPELKRAALNSEFTLYQGDWKHRAVRARFAGSFAKGLMRPLPVLEFMDNYGLTPDMMPDVELITTRNTKPGEGKFRTTVFLNQRLVDQGSVDEWMGQMIEALNRGENINDVPVPPIRESKVALGHIASDNIEELEQLTTDLQFAPVEMKQSEVSRLRESATKELDAFVNELNDIRHLASLANDMSVVEQIAPVLEGWLEVREALKGGDTNRLLELQKQLREQRPEDVTNLATKIPSLVDYVEFLQGEKQPKGRIRMGATKIDIELLKNADLSTFIHESAHFFLEIMQELAPDHAEVAQDLATIKNWLGMTDDQKFNREHHELWARGFERYLLEGKAPVPRLQMAFARFKAWLVGVYQSMSDLDVELNDEVRGVFDRMLASQAEIAEARKEKSEQPLFADPRAVGMSEKEAAEYNDAHNAAKLSAEEYMTAKIMQEFEREKSRVWNAERIKVREEVSHEADEDATMRLWSLISRGYMPSGAELPPGVTQFKLDRVAVEAQYPPEVVARLSPRLLAKAGGQFQVAHPTIVADLFGFESAESMLESLAVQEDPKQWIEKKTNERMRSRRYDGTPLKTMEIPTEARKAVHNEKRAQLMQKELQILASTNLPAMKGLIRRLTRRLPKLEEVRTEAKDLIAAKRIRDIKPDVYRRAESTAAKDAMEAFLKGDLEQAFDHKQRELLNHELYRAASEAKDAVTSGVKFMQRLSKAPAQKRLAKAGGSYQAQIESLLERFDFSPISNIALDKKQSLQDFLEEQQSLGLTPDMPDHVKNEAFRKHYKNLTFTELQGIVESAQLIKHLSTLKNRLLASQRQRTVNGAVGEMTAAMVAHLTIDRAEPIDLAPDLTGRIKRGAKGLIAAHTKMEFLFEWLDGNTNNGPNWANAFLPLAQAESAEHVMNTELIPKLKEIFAIYPKAERARWFWHKVDVKEVGMKMTKANILAVALNWGNEGNRTALMEGYNWTEPQVEAILNQLDARDAATVGKIWDLIGSYWPQIEALEKELNGVAPERVEPTPVVIAGVPLPGGYYPIIGDAQLSWRQGILDTQQQAVDMFGGRWAKAMTKHGHTKERSDFGGRPVKLDLTPMAEHLTNVVHDLTHRRAIIDVSRITQHPDFKNAVENGLGVEMYRQIHPWLVNIAAGQRTEFYNPIEGLFARGRMGATVVNMGYKMTTALTQVLSYTNTIKEIGPKYSALGLSDVWGKPHKLRESWNFVTSRSPMMDERITSYDRDVRDALSNLNVAGINPGPLSVVTAYTNGARDSFFMFIGLMDMAVSLPTWLGAYRQSMDGNTKGITSGDEPAAIAYADKVVRETQGVGAPKDMAAVQRGSDVYKIFTMFYSYFSVLFNQFAKSTHQLGLDKNVARYAASMALLWFLPAALQDLMLGRAPDPDDDKEKWYKWLLTSQAKYPFQTVIILRDIINGMDRYGYEPSAALEMFASVAASLRASGKLFTDEEITRAEAKNAAMAAGYVTKMPSRQLWQTGEYFYDWMNGNVNPDNPVEAMWRALVTGTPKE